MLILRSRGVTVCEVANQFWLSHKSAYEIVLADFTSVKFVQDGFKNNPQSSIDITIWTSVTVF
jgi:hypothetical protein